MPNLVGTGLNQVPTNGMLGGLAYQSPDHASIKDLDLKNLSQINSEIADTAVDIFIYDTSKDSDGGAWRHRTSHTSWYNETLNTATRGSRREFPAVAVIVAETNQVTIYDGDDPDMPMWMVFNHGGSWMSTSNALTTTAAQVRAVSALNGIIIPVNSNGYGNVEISLIADEIKCRQFNVYLKYSGFISERNNNLGYVSLNASSTTFLINSDVNDVAMTVLPNAPIDDATGLPIPTIAVATNGGVSVIKDDGNVYDVIDSNSARICYDVSFTKDHKIMHTGDLGAGSTHAGNVFVTNVLTDDRPEYDNHSDLYRWYSTSSMYPRINGGNTFNTRVLDPLDVGGHHYAMADVGISLIEDGTSSSYGNTDGMVAYATTSYNTGWMHGDIKGAFLSDTDATNVTGTELVTNGTFDSDVSGWTPNTNNTITWAGGGYADVYRGAGGGAVVAYQTITTEIGKKYVISFDVISLPSNHAQMYVQSIGGVGSLNITVGYRTTTGTSIGVFTADDTQTRITLYAYPGVTVRYDNVSVRLAEEDRSVNGTYVDSTNSGKGLQVFGTITKSAVATGAELVAYSGFSGSNYLQSPQGSISVGTSDFCLSIWYKRSTGNEINVHFDFIEGTTNGFRLVPGNTANDIYLINGNFSTFVVFSGKAIGSGVWTHLSVVRDYGTNVKVYQNGILVGTTTTFASTNYNAGGVFKVSGSPDSSTCISLIRLSASAPSAEQIKKMYEDEKVLFQENAACTLYGSSDAVTALAYDEVTERLHVGTSSGRSEFQGLRRINNTTTAVTTAISAYDSFVVEQ